MGKKTEKQIDRLRADVQALTEAVWALKDQVRVEVAAASAASSKVKGSRRRRQVSASLDTDAQRGAISSYGSIRATGRAGTPILVQWQQDHVSLDQLIPDDVDMAAARLSAIGHRQRLAILLALLERPTSAGELVTALSLGTTGAAYHHLNVLQGTGFVMQPVRGTWQIAPERIPEVIGMLSALVVVPTVEVIGPDGTASVDESGAQPDPAI